MNRTMSKLSLYVKMIFRLAVGNRLRLLLTVIGMGLGIFIYALGTFLLEGYYYGSLKEATVIPENAMQVRLSPSMYMNQSQMRGELYTLLEQTTPVIVRSEYVQSRIKTMQTTSGKSLQVYGYVQGVTDMMDVGLFYHPEKGNRLVPFELVCGRYLTIQEIQNNETVAVIDEYTAKLLFGDSDPLGQLITLRKSVNDYSSDRIAFTIVGVVKNNYYVERDVRNAEEALFDSSNEMGYTAVVNVNIYCPYDSYKHFGIDESELRETNFFWTLEKKEYSLARYQLKSFIDGLDTSYGVFPTVYDRAYYLDILEKQLEPVRTGVQVASLILLTIAGVSSMSVLFFAMKERMAEIGIKKAFGASFIDIVVQFLYENLLISFIGSVLAVGVAVGVLLGMRGYIVEAFFADFEVVLTAKSLLLPLLIGCLQGCLFSLLPCMIAAGSSVTKALRMDV